MYIYILYIYMYQFTVFLVVIHANHCAIVNAALQGIHPGALVVPNFGPRSFCSHTIFMPSPILRQGSIQGRHSQAWVLDTIKQLETPTLAKLPRQPSQRRCCRLTSSMFVTMVFNLVGSGADTVFSSNK